MISYDERNDNANKQGDDDEHTIFPIRPARRKRLTEQSVFLISGLGRSSLPCIYQNLIEFRT